VTPYEVRLSRNAEGYLRRLRRADQERILGRLQQIAANPFGPYSKPLSNLAGRRSARVGDWRVILTLDHDQRLVNVSDIGPRGQVYRRL